MIAILIDTLLETVDNQDPLTTQCSKALRDVNLSEKLVTL